MIVTVFGDGAALGRAAAVDAAALIRAAVEKHGDARIIAATGASQFAFLDALTAERDVPWAQVELFHLDEYIGLPIAHPGSFRKMLLEQLINKTGIVKYHLLDGDGDAKAAVVRASTALASAAVDIAFLGIGENGHLAFNDPPADFATEQPYLVVQLDEACRRQQVGEGWFTSLDQVPQQAITMSIRQILKSASILCIVPDKRKAQAVKDSLEGEVGPGYPASVLQQHPRTTIYLDPDSASLLSELPDV